MNRVVVTGLGVVSPVGSSLSAYWAALVAGRSGFGPPTFTETGKNKTKIVAEVTDFVASDHFDARALSWLDRVSQFAVVAARQAFAQSGLSSGGETGERTAVIVGTAAGGQGTAEESLRRFYTEDVPRIPPMTIPKTMISAAPSQVSMTLGLKGPTFAVSSACASSTHAIGQAFQMIRSGAVTCALAGGTDACITAGVTRGWEAMRILATDTCRPFSRERTGMVIGEGAAIVVLEALDHAQARGAEILAEIAGFGMGADAGDLTSPQADGMARAMRMALADGALAPDAIDYINAHGTGTTINDKLETAAVHAVFGDGARELALSSTKSMIGHALGAAGALELTATFMAIRDGIVPPTMNYLGPDPACDLDYTPNAARRRPIRAALSNSFAFGGLNAVLAVRQFAG
ncbi:MAG TPA: beta-ketoacyl-[acyl-carrier-protein] synthase family protein [Xanthobacteraceae bacterium]